MSSSSHFILKQLQEHILLFESITIGTHRAVVVVAAPGKDYLICSTPTALRIIGSPWILTENLASSYHHYVAISHLARSYQAIADDRIIKII